jgi:hypothetical protein
LRRLKPEFSVCARSASNLFRCLFPAFGIGEAQKAGDEKRTSVCHFNSLASKPTEALAVLARHNFGFDETDFKTEPEFARLNLAPPARACRPSGIDVDNVVTGLQSRQKPGVSRLNVQFPKSTNAQTHKRTNAVWRLDLRKERGTERKILFGCMIGVIKNREQDWRDRRAVLFYNGLAPSPFGALR